MKLPGLWNCCFSGLLCVKTARHCSLLATIDAGEEWGLCAEVGDVKCLCSAAVV
jgi:hypothetical protein